MTLKERVHKVCGNQFNFAEQMDLSRVQVNMLLNGKANWTQRNIYRAAYILDVAPSTIIRELEVTGNEEKEV